MRATKAIRACNALRAGSQVRQSSRPVRLPRPWAHVAVSWGYPSRSLTTTTAAATEAQDRRPSAELASFLTSGSRPQRAEPAVGQSPAVGQTPLYELHQARGGKMVTFAGFAMPVSYGSQSITAEHAFTRENASLFDVGHMVQRVLRGPGSAAFLERVTPSDLRNLPAGRGNLSCLLKPSTGGIVDDTIITRVEGSGSGGTFYVVTNAGCRDKDNKYLQDEIRSWNADPANAELQVEQEILEGWGLVALQGPKAAEILSEVLAEPEKVDLKQVLFGQAIIAKLRAGPESGKGCSALISRGGYTGEDGFEISIQPRETLAVTETLLATAGPERLQLAGLGARDSLRLEAGLCLYGNDIDESRTPVEAGLSWIIPKTRRAPDAGFHGAEVISRQLVPKSKGGSGVEYKRVGLVVEGVPARQHAQLVALAQGDGQEKELDAGVVTSGCPSPTLKSNIAMGYVRTEYSKAGTQLQVIIRGKHRQAVVTKMPFVPTKYWKGMAPA